METIDKRLVMGIEKFEKSIKNTNGFTMLEEANSNFKKMISKGIVQKRGNNLLVSAEIPISKVKFNV